MTLVCPSAPIKFPVEDPRNPADDESMMSSASAMAAGSAQPEDATPHSVVGRSRNEGHGARLTSALEALERFPALAESRNRVLTLVAEERPSTSDVVCAIESDVALVIAVMRMANRASGDRRWKVENVVEGVEVLSSESVQRLAQAARR